MHIVEFVSYDGAWPNLCSGRLVLRLDWKEVPFPPYCLSSGGYVSFNEDGEEEVGSGPWNIRDWPEGWPEDAKEAAVECVNNHITKGCCGGCVQEEDTMSLRIDYGCLCG